MRIRIQGDNETARTVAGYLHRAGIAVVERRPDLTIDLMESDAESHVGFDSVDGELHHHLFREVRRATQSAIFIAPRESRTNDRLIRITLPQNDEHRLAVARGVLHGVAEYVAARRPKHILPWKRKTTQRNP